MQLKQSATVLLFACAEASAQHAFVTVELVAEIEKHIKPRESSGFRMLPLARLYEADAGFVQDKTLTLGLHLSVITAVGCVSDK